jgi:hypothetical protein
MAGVNDIIAFGFGGWSTVAKVPTWGFGIGAAASLITPAGLDYSVDDSRLYYSIRNGRPHYTINDNRLYVKVKKHGN